MISTVFVLLSIVYMVYIVASTVWSLCRTDRLTRCRRLRNYKKGKFMALYAAAFPLYFIAYYNSGISMVRVFLSSFNAMIKMAVVSFDMDVIEPMMEESILFAVAFYMCMALTICNVLLFSVSVFFRSIYNRICLTRLGSTSKDICVLVGYNDGMKKIIKSTRDNDINLLVLSEKLSDEFKEEMYAAKAAYVAYSQSSDIAELIYKCCGGIYKAHVEVIIHTEDESFNLKCATQISNLVSDFGTDIAMANGRNRIDAYVFSESAGDSVYRNVIRRAKGSLHCVNRYKILAFDFTDEHPITEFLSEHIDTESAAIEEGTDLRIIMVGFGKVNRQLFKTYTQNNQCMIKKNGDLDEMRLKYHIFDRDNAQEEASFNHTYLHYNRWLSQNEDGKDYFAYPAEPAEVTFHRQNINSKEFFDELSNCMSGAERSAHLIIISLGEDIKALDLASQIAENARDMKHAEDTRIFVRVRSRSLAQEIIKNQNDQIPIIPFGDTESLFDYDRIVKPSIEGMAKDRHLCYATEQISLDKTEEEARRAALEKWLFKWENIQRESNIFGCLAIRMRLQLMGFDYVSSDSPEEDASEEFLASYNKGNPISYEDKTVNGKRIVNYDVEYEKKGSVRDTLARVEHQRWNAYMISNGFVPASKSEYSAEGKDALMRRRRHINLTDFEGLHEYAAWRVEREGISASDADVIKYDFQLLDDVVWMLSRAGYKIIKVK